MTLRWTLGSWLLHQVEVACGTQSPIFIYNKGNLEPPSPLSPIPYQSQAVPGSKNRLNKSSKVLPNTETEKNTLRTEGGIYL